LFRVVFLIAQHLPQALAAHVVITVVCVSMRPETKDKEEGA
jgi:hypothetical protein